MAKNGHEMINVDAGAQDPAATGKTRLFGDQATGLPSAITDAGVVIPWGAVSPIAPEVKSADFTVGDADNLSTYDCQGAVTCTLEAGVTAGVTVWLHQTLPGQVTTITGDVGVTMISHEGNLDPVYFLCQGGAIKLVSYGSDTWYLESASECVNSGDVPLLFTGCIGWYDLDDYLNTTDAVNQGDPITTILDKSPAGNDLSQANAANQGTIDTSLANINGRNAMRCDGSNFYPLPADIYNLSAGNNTVVAIAWQVVESNSDWIIGAQSNAERWGFETSSNEWEWRSGGTCKEGSGDTDVPRCLMGVRNGPTLILYDENGVRASTGNGSNQTNANGALGSRGSASNALNGWIAEVFVYEQARTAEEIEVIAQYAKGKYGL